jgi:hypothetical protein
MMTDDDLIEQKIQATNPTAPRLTPGEIEATIIEEQYHRFPGTTVTVCCLTLQNGYGVIGESAAVSPENFDPEVGKFVARNAAFDKIWVLEGYLLKQRLFETNYQTSAEQEYDAL